jgi:hypothetical protein
MVIARIPPFRCPRLALAAVIVGLLFQQVTLAAYRCPMTPGAVESGMAMPTAGHGSSGDRLRCQLHCAHQAEAPGGTHTVAVPPHLLVALSSALATPPAVPILRVTKRPERYRLRIPPRPAIRIYCSLLI